MHLYSVSLVKIWNWNENGKNYFVLCSVNGKTKEEVGEEAWFLFSAKEWGSYTNKTTKNEWKLEHV